MLALTALGAGLTAQEVRPSITKTSATESEKDAIIRHLQLDNQRLNTEVKSATRELLALNQQLRTLHDTSARPGTPLADTKAEGELRAESRRVSSDNARLSGERESAIKDAGNITDQLRDARNEVTRLTLEIQQLRAERRPGDTGSPYTSLRQIEALRAENVALAARIAELEKQLEAARPRPAVASKS